MRTAWALMVMPRSRSRSMESSTWACISRAVSDPVSSSRRSASVDLPWSICAIIAKLRMKAASMSEWLILDFNRRLNSSRFAAHSCDDIASGGDRRLLACRMSSPVKSCSAEDALLNVRVEHGEKSYEQSACCRARPVGKSTEFRGTNDFAQSTAIREGKRTGCCSYSRARDRRYGRWSSRRSDHHSQKRED